MAGFGNSAPQGFITSTAGTDLCFTPLYIRGRYNWPVNGYDSLVKEFKRVCVEIQARDVIIKRARQRVTGLDYKTPAGVRPYWFKPEPPAGEPPAGLSLPCWREYKRRRT